MIIVAINENPFYIIPLWMSKGEQEKSTFKVLYVSSVKMFLSCTAITHA